MTLPLTGAGPSVGGSYAAKVLSYSPIAYWPLWEPSGGVAECLVNPAQNGAYTGVTLGQPGIGDGRTCPLFDGLNDYVNIYTTTFRDKFALTNNDTDPISEGTVMIWARVANIGVWTDGLYRHMVNLQVDNDNRIFIRKDDSDRVHWRYEAGNVQENARVVSADLGWINYSLTWSKSAGANGEVRYYRSGGVADPMDTALGIWAGNLSNVDTCIGAVDTTVKEPWYGWLAHGVIYGRALLPPEIADLAVV